jgi:N-acetylmuramic acid 6-phosphate etherase|tara:strand:- start:6570 stop:7466 length:897 start_codon:yes stop_codon:yes gene_type:complete
MIERKTLKTEQQNKNSLKIDQFSISEILETINKEDQKIASAVNKSLADVSKVVSFAKSSLISGGRVFYAGAGTSGRLGVLDASECPPTYSAPKDWFIGVIAGGDRALKESIEGAEDDKAQAIIDLLKYDINSNDTLIGISCSGAAKYVISSLEHARKRGAKTVYLITNPIPYLSTEVDAVISVDTGPEIIAGSTRMKAGTATKMILNMISTATMISMGKVYGNLMVDLMAVNDKLVDRGARIIKNVTGQDYDFCKNALFEANKSVKIAIVMISNSCNYKEAVQLIKTAGGSLRNVING